VENAQQSMKEKIIGVSTATFFWFQIYQLEFFIHFSARIKAIGIIRPTILLFLIITFLLFSQKEKLAARLKHPIFMAYGSFLLMLLFTLPFVSYPGSVIKNNIPVFLKAIVFLYFVALILDTPKRFKWALVVFVCCQVFRILEPLYLNITQGYWGDSTNIDGEFADRLGGAPADVIDANELGFVIATVIPFLHYYLLPRSWMYKLIYFALLPPLLYALILTMSRGAFLALLVVGWIIFKESKNKMLLICVAIGIVVAALGVMNENQRDRYLSLVSSDSKQTKSKEGRIRGMKTEFIIGLTRPVFGHGLGTTSETKVHNGYKPQAAHNMYAEVLIEVGFVGMFFFFRFIRRVYQQLAYSITHSEHVDEFYKATCKILKIVFWMFIVYSINYWGLTQYYWYNLAGLTIAFAYLSGTVMESRKLR
jgi:putative inorganic carbon (HCO3(-)) transporter